MARSLFRLQALLTMRLVRRRECRTRLAGALSELAAATARVQALEAALTRLRDPAAKGTLDLARVRAADDARATLGAEVARLHSQLRVARSEVDRRQQEVALADGEVKALEHLQQRALAAAQQAQLLTEARQLDELAASSSCRSRT